MIKKPKSSVTERGDLIFFRLYETNIYQYRLVFFKSHSTSDSENQLMEIEVTSDCVAQGVENHDEDKYHGDIKFFLRP